MFQINMSRRKRSSFAAALLAVIAIFVVRSPDFDTRALTGAEEQETNNKRDEFKFKFSEEIIKQASDFHDNGHIFNSTIATAFFELPNSKHGIDEYLEWAKNSLCLTDAMVIFTNVPEKLAPLREHAKDRTVIVPMQVEELEIGNDIHITDEQWEHQLEIVSGFYQGKNFDFNLFKIWAGKSWLVNQALELNPFSSDVYHWMDIGHFRKEPWFCGETVVRHPEIVPEDRMMLFMGRDIRIQENREVPDAIVVKDEFASTYIPGGWIAGRANVWPEFLQRFEETISIYLLLGISLTEDQALLETTCIRNEGLCALVRRDNHVGYVDQTKQFETCSDEECKEKAGWRQGGWCTFFNMKYYFWHGGNFKFWDPATGLPSEDEDFALWHPFVNEVATKRVLYLLDYLHRNTI